MQENSTMFAKCDTIEEKESHDKLVHLAVSEILSLSENQLQEGLIVIRYYLALRGAENGVTAMVTPFFCVQG